MSTIPNINQLKRFLQRIENQLGLVFSESKYSRLQKHLTARIQELECETVDEYLDMLIDKRWQTKEIAWWTNVLTVGETYFYRNQPQWEVLQKYIIPELLNQHREDRKLSFWSAGCATGEEPYTLAIILSEVITDLPSWHIDILATDLNSEFINTAKNAQYGKRSVRELDSEQLRKYFIKKNDSYIVRSKIRNMVSFMIHNLVSDWRRKFNWHKGYFDVILCQNVIMYFDRERAKRVLQALADSLNDNGYLFLGHSETLLSMDLDFDIQRIENAFFYRKAGVKEKSDFTAVIHTSSVSSDVLISEPSLGESLRSKKIKRQTENAAQPGHKTNHTIPETTEKKVTTIDDSAPSEEDMLIKAKQFLVEDKAEEAEEFLSVAVNKFPLSKDIHLLHGIAAKNRGKTDKAISAFRQVLYLDGDNLLARFYLASLWQACGTYERALTQYRILLGQTSGQDPNKIIGSTDDLTIGLLRAACEKALQQNEKQDRNQARQYRYG